MGLHTIFSSMKGDQTKFPKYLDSVFFPWVAQILQALIGNFFFLLAGIRIVSSASQHLTSFRVELYEVLSLHLQVKSWTDLSLESIHYCYVIQSLATDSRNCLYLIFSCELMTLYSLKELKIPQLIRYSTALFPFHHFPQNETTRKEFICMVNTFHVVIVFLDAGRFYNILSHFPIFFLLVGQKYLGSLIS